MKKRLLITSIVMMLVVAVALGTSTYAWFTSNDSVTATPVSLTAATNNQPSLGISWVDGNYASLLDNPTAPVGGFAPATPLTLDTKAAVEASNEDALDTATNANVLFKTATAKAVGGDMVFGQGPQAATAYTWNNTTYSSIFLKNLSPSSPITSVTLTATIGDAEGSDNVGASELIRIGVFKNDGNGTFELLGVLANVVDKYVPVPANTQMDESATYYKLYLGKYVAAVPGTSAAVTAKTADFYDEMSAPEGKFYTKVDDETMHAKAVYGTITNGASVNAMPTIDCVESIIVASSLDALETIELKIVVWEDAIALGDAEQGKQATIALSFGASNS